MGGCRGSRHCSHKIGVVGNPSEIGHENIEVHTERSFDTVIVQVSKGFRIFRAIVLFEKKNLCSKGFDLPKTHIVYIADDEVVK